MFIFRRKRSVPDPDLDPHDVHGGERAFLYEVHYGSFYEIRIFHFIFQFVENYLFNFGMDGKGCLLRAICETHESPLLGYGVVGEILELFLT